MSNKKQLLSESEVRRFMALANIPAINENLGGAMGSGEGEGEYELQQEVEEDPMAGEPEMGGEEPMADEPGEEEAPMDMGGGSKEEKVKQLIDLIADIADVDIEYDGDEGGEEEIEIDDAGEEGGEEESGEAEMDADEESDEEESEEELQEQIIQTVLARVSARLVAEAKKKKDDKKDKKDDKKKSLKDRLKAAKDKKKKLEEANAPAPKSTNSNGEKKGAGSATKGNWGVNEKVPDQSWEKGTSKRGHKMEDVTPSAEHITTHGKKNLATMGGNKKKV